MGHAVGSRGSERDHRASEIPMVKKFVEAVADPLVVALGAAMEGRDLTADEIAVSVHVVDNIKVSKSELVGRWRGHVALEL